jgi:hypothetical protein
VRGMSWTDRIRPPARRVVTSLTVPSAEVRAGRFGPVGMHAGSTIRSATRRRPSRSSARLARKRSSGLDWRGVGRPNPHTSHACGSSKRHSCSGRLSRAVRGFCTRGESNAQSPTRPPTPTLSLEGRGRVTQRPCHPFVWGRHTFGGDTRPTNGGFRIWREYIHSPTK